MDSITLYQRQHSSTSDSVEGSITARRVWIYTSQEQRMRYTRYPYIDHFVPTQDTRKHSCVSYVRNRDAWRYLAGALRRDGFFCLNRDGFRVGAEGRDAYRRAAICGGGGSGGRGMGRERSGLRPAIRDGFYLLNKVRHDDSADNPTYVSLGAYETSEGVKCRNW